jgi:hypothetical protein
VNTPQGSIVAAVESAAGETVISDPYSLTALDRRCSLRIAFMLLAIGLSIDCARGRWMSSIAEEMLRAEIETGDSWLKGTLPPQPPT